MTQSELSEGIISVSYLSKIENGVVTPPEEVIWFLCGKLDIELDSGDNKQMEKICKDWFETLFHQELDNTHELYKQIEENKEHLPNKSLVNLVEIHTLRYYLIHKKQQEANEQYKKLKRISTQFDDKERYYWLKFSGYYWFRLSSHNNALSHFQEAENYLHVAFYEIDDEEYSLYYMIGLSASYVKKAHLVYKYASKALQYYERKIMLKQAADCHLLLGISFVRSKDFQSALENFTLVEKIAHTINDKSLLAISMQNIGNLHSFLNESQKAILYFEKSYELKDTVNSQILPITSLMKEYYKVDELEKVNYWLNKGIKLLRKDEAPSIYRFELEVYNQLINGIDEKKFEQLVSNEVIPFLDRREQHYEKVPFLEVLADYYFDNRKYKLAATYYNQALKITSNL